MIVPNAKLLSKRASQQAKMLILTLPSKTRLLWLTPPHLHFVRHLKKKRARKKICKENPDLSTTPAAGSERRDLSRAVTKSPLLPRHIARVGRSWLNCTYYLSEREWSCAVSRSAQGWLVWPICLTYCCNTMWKKGSRAKTKGEHNNLGAADERFHCPGITAFRLNPSLPEHICMHFNGKFTQWQSGFPGWPRSEVQEPEWVRQEHSIRPRYTTRDPTWEAGGAGLGAVR